MGHLYTYRSHIELMGNVPMPGPKERRFPSTDSWANSIVCLRTFVSELEASSSLTKDCAYNWRRANLRILEEQGKI